MRLINHLLFGLVIFGLIFSASAIANQAHARDNQFFIAGGVAVSSLEYDEIDDFGDFDDTKFSYQARAGYMFNNWIGFEGAYFGFDEFDERIDGNRVDVDLNGYGLAGIFNVPLAFVDLYAKGGVMYLDTDTTINVLGNRISEDDGIFEPYAAIGAEFDMGIVNLYAEYNKIIESDDLDADIFAGGVKLEF